jgi:hypothetical protein
VTYAVPSYFPNLPNENTIAPMTGPKPNETTKQPPGPTVMQTEFQAAMETQDNSNGISRGGTTRGKLRRALHCIIQFAFIEYTASTGF